jgi:hypothetical protein
VAQASRPGLTAEQKREMWSRWKAGQSVHIELVILNNDALCRLDFQDEITRQKVLQATTSAHLKALFLA